MEQVEVNGRRAGWRTAGAALALTLVAGLVVAGSAGAAPVDPIAPGNAPPLDPAAASMPGPVGTVQSEIVGVDRPVDVTEAPDGSLWFNSTDGRFRIDEDLAFEPAPGTGRGVMTRGPDGEIWSAEFYGVVRTTTDGTETSFSYGVSVGQIEDITTGPDGNLWMTNTGFGGEPVSIIRMTPAGAFTAFPDPRLGVPSAITAGPDGNVWFADGTRIGKITPAGVVSHVTVPGPVYVNSIVGGPDGNVWFTGLTGIGRVTPAGVITIFNDPGVPNPHQIVAGSDGNLWLRPGVVGVLAMLSPAGAITTVATPGLGAFGSLTATAGTGLGFADFAGSVGRVSFSGEVTAVPSATFSDVGQMITGPDGDVWFSNPSGDRILRVSESFEGATFTGSGIDGPRGITVGADGNVWFANTANSSIGRITPAGVVSNFVGANIDGPTAVALGGDGNVWFVNDGNGTIGRITPAGVVTTFAASGIDVLATNPDLSRNDIATAPDGSLWFTSSGDDRIGHVALDGTITWRSAYEKVARPRFIVVAPDGNVWWVNAPISTTLQRSVSRMAPSGEIATVHVDNVLQPVSFDLELGPDGNIWTGSLRFAPDGALRPKVPGHESIRTPRAVGPEGAMWSAGYGTVTRVKVVADGTVLFRSAVAGKERATVSWAPPRMPVGPPITGYSVVATPGGASCSTTTVTSCVVTGLAPGTSYTFAIRAIGSGGPGPAAVTSSVVPWSGSGYHPLVPSRILDSRLPNVGFSGKVVAGTPRSLQVTGLGGASNVPASATAVVMNVTVTGSTAESFLTAYPTGAAVPIASNLNFGAGQVIPNLVTVKLGAGGRVDLATAAGATNVVADVVGYYDDGEVIGDRFTPTTPRRILDTRNPFGLGPLVAGTPQDLSVVEGWPLPGVPATATAVAVNLTVTGGTAQSFVSAWPSGTPQPGVSNLNLLPGQTIPNLAIVKVGEDNKIRLANAVGSVHVIVDLVGWFDPTSGSRFHAMDPDRVLDTRDGTGLTGKQTAGQIRALAVAGAAGTGVPAGATGLVANVTVADATAESFVSVFPGAGPRPDPFSNLNFATNQVIPNLTATGIAPDGTVGFYNHLGQTHLIADAVGWYASY